MCLGVGPLTLLLLVGFPSDVLVVVKIFFKILLYVHKLVWFVPSSVGRF
jgi:hypothetical protein